MEKFRTLGQERSAFALKKVLENKSITALKNFSAGAPSMILQNGFGQAMAFWASKGKDEHTVLLNIVREWFNEKQDFFIKSQTIEEFFTKLSKSSQQDYFTAQQEALNLLEWVKRYTHAFIEDKK